MGKRKYRSTAFDKVDWLELKAKTDGQEVVFAVDVAKEDFVAAVMKGDREVLATVKWQHPQQSRALVETVYSHFAGTGLKVAMEPTGTYGDAVQGLFREAGVDVYRVIPKRVHDAAEIFDGVPSLHDAKAAYLIGRLHLDGVSERWQGLSPERREMKALQGLMTHYKRQLQQSRGRLEALLARHWPELPQLVALDSATLLHLVGQYGSPAQVCAHRAEARELIRRVGGNGLKAAKCEQILDSAASTVGLACVEAERELLQTLAQEMDRTRRQLRELERRLEAKVERDPVLGYMATALGHITSVVLMSLLGSPLDYGDSASYQKAMGLNLKERSSGKYKGKLKFTKRGPSLARFYLYFAVLRLIKRDPNVQRWYQSKVKRDGGLKGKAIGAVMRKLAKALWHVARGERFDSSKLFNVDGLAVAA